MFSKCRNNLHQEIKSQPISRFLGALSYFNIYFKPFCSHGCHSNLGSVLRPPHIAKALQFVQCLAWCFKWDRGYTVIKMLKTAMSWYEHMNMLNSLGTERWAQSAWRRWAQPNARRGWECRRGRSCCMCAEARPQH